MFITIILLHVIIYYLLLRCVLRCRWLHHTVMLQKTRPTSFDFKNYVVRTRYVVATLNVETKKTTCIFFLFVETWYSTFDVFMHRNLEQFTILFFPNKKNKNL